MRGFRKENGSGVWEGRRFDGQADLQIGAELEGVSDDPGRGALSTVIEIRTRRFTSFPQRGFFVFNKIRRREWHLQM